jgi:hypothetical protein
LETSHFLVSMGRSSTESSWRDRWTSTRCWKKNKQDSVVYRPDRCSPYHWAAEQSLK